MAPSGIPAALPGRIFAGLEPGFHAIVNAAGETRRHPAGAHLHLEGAHATHVSVIVEGVAKTTRNGERGEAQLLRVVGQDEVVGVRPVLAGGPYATTATALEPCTVFMLAADVFRALLRESANLNGAVMSHLAFEGRCTEDMLMVLTQRPVRRRIAELLLLLHGHPVPGGNWRPIPQVKLKRKDMAQLVATTPETLSRTLADFAARGWIDVDRRRIELVDAAALASFEDPARAG